MTDTRTLSGRYRITGHLARGGMGDVFEAEDLSLGRKVAVKILHPQFAADEAFVARFRREAQAAANLSHPNIVSIFDWGEENGTYFMVMELIDGRTLRDIRRSEGALLPRRAAEIAAEAAAALSVAHAAGVFHRDVKPGNIMLAPDGSVKVTDFGIARALDDSEELTRTGAVIGTATYFSPEQAQGLPADARSDVYSLGVVLYELLCGQAPFTGESPVAVAYQHVSEFAPPPSEINPDVPAALEMIVERAMEKAPGDRYQSAEEFRTDLVRYLRGDTPAAALEEVQPQFADHVAGTQLMTPPPPPATVPPDEIGRHVAHQLPEDRQSQLPYVLGIFGLLVALVIGVFILLALLRDDPTTTSSNLVTVPDLTDRAAVDAFDELQAQNLRVRQRNQASDSVAAGFVITTEPVPGTQVEPESFVVVVVSSGPEQFAIPNLIDLTEEEATALLESNNFVLGEITTRFDESVPEGVVINQTPRPGTNAPPGTVVDLEVSSGPFALEMPDVLNQAEDAAIEALVRVGFSAENIVVEPEFSEEILPGFVVRTDPTPGRLAGREDTVTLYVSQGPEPFAAPGLVGLSESDAREQAETLGLVLIVDERTVEVTADSGLAGLVAAQDPASGTEVVPGDEITVRIGVLKQVEVPNLIGLTLDQATADLEALGLNIEVIGDTIVDPESGLDGLVATQDPAAGTEVDDGSTVRVQIGVLPEEEPPEDPPPNP